MVERQGGENYSCHGSQEAETNRKGQGQDISCKATLPGTYLIELSPAELQTFQSVNPLTKLVPGDPITFLGTTSEYCHSVDQALNT